MRTPVRALLAAVVAILAVAMSASAAVRHHAGIWQHHVRLVPLAGGGTSIHVGGRGSLRAVVLSPEAIAAAAVRDIDADGDLDIIASGGNGLVVWRNLGAGRYALAAPPGKGKFSRRFGPGLAPFRNAGQTSGLGEQRQHLAAAQSTLTTRVAPTLSSAAPHHTIVHAPAVRPHAGRAPPVRA
jgi:hypothetical protein